MDPVSVKTRYALLRDMARNAPDLIPPGTHIPTLEEEAVEIAALTRPVQETIQEREHHGRTQGVIPTMNAIALAKQLDRIEGMIDMLTAAADDLKDASQRLGAAAGELAVTVRAARG